MEAESQHPLRHEVLPSSVRGTSQPPTVAALCCFHWELHRAEFLLRKASNISPQVEGVISMYFVPDLTECLRICSSRCLWQHSFARSHGPTVYNCFCTLPSNADFCCLKLSLFARIWGQFSNLADALILIFHAPYPRYPVLSPKLAVTSHSLSDAQTHPSFPLHLQRGPPASKSLPFTGLWDPWLQSLPDLSHLSAACTWSSSFDLLHLTLPALKPYLLWYPHSCHWPSPISTYTLSFPLWLVGAVSFVKNTIIYTKNACSWSLQK